MVVPFPTINLLAVVAAAVAAFILGAVWYAPPVFGNMWMRLLGKKREELGMAGPAFAASFVGSIIAAAVLAVFVGYAQATTALDGAVIGLWAWIGFVITVTAGDVLFAKKPVNLFLLNNAYELVAFLVMGAILGIVR